MVGDVEKAPPSILYSTLNPGTAETVGKVNEAPQVLPGTVIVGAAGNTTAFIVVSWQAAIPLITSAGVVPHEDPSLYLAFIVQHPAVFVSKLLTRFKLELYALSVPPGACTAYSATNPAITGTAVMSAS